MSETSQGPGWWQASDGKWYPPQAGTGQQFPQQQPVVVEKKGGCLRWVGIGALALLGLIVVGVIVAIAGGSDDDDEKGSGSSSQAPTQQTYTVGQTARTGDFEVTLHKVENPFRPTNQFERPPAGQHFVATELTIRNTSEEQQTMSTLLGAEILDSQSRPWDIAIAGTDRPQLEGTVAAGESRRGWMVFAVADDATGLRLRIKGSLTATGSVFLLE